MEGRLNVFIDFARPPKPERRRVDLAAVVGETLALVGGRARKQRVTLKFTPPATPVEVEADGEQVRQLLVNLALNALDVMPRGGVLEIELRPAERTITPSWRCSTRGRASRRGTCPGSTSRSSPARRRGSGWAWSSPSGSLASHGGSLRATNRPQGGACFVLRLPDDARAGLGISSGTDMATILVIDDESLHPARLPPGLRRPRGHAADGLRRVRGAGARRPVPARRGRPGPEPARHVRPGRVPPHPHDRRAHPGHLHHRPRDHRDGHRGDEAGGVRLPAQAAGRRPRPGAGRAGRGDQPADAHARHGRRRGAGAGPGRRPRRPLAGDAGGLQGDRPGRAAGRRPC